MNIKKQDVWKALGGAAIVTLLLFLCGLAAAAPANSSEPNNSTRCETFDRNPFYLGEMSQTKNEITVTLGQRYQAGRDWHLTSTGVLGKITIRSNGSEQDRTGKIVLNGDHGSDIEWATVCMTPPEPVLTETYSWLLPDGGTAQKVTWPQTLVGEGVLTPSECGVTYQVDTYRGTRAQIDAVVADRVLTGPSEDGHLLVSNGWTFTSGPRCTPDPTPLPAPTHTKWVDGAWKCDDTTVTQTRTRIDYTQPAFDTDTWTWPPAVPGEPVTETQTRDLTESEMTVCPTPPAPTPTPTQPSTDPTSTPEPTVTVTPLTSTSAPRPFDNSSTSSPMTSELAYTGTSPLLWALGALAMIGGGAWMKWRKHND